VNWRRNRRNRKNDVRFVEIAWGVERQPSRLWSSTDMRQCSSHHRKLACCISSCAKSYYSLTIVKYSLFALLLLASYFFARYIFGVGRCCLLCAFADKAGRLLLNPLSFRKGGATWCDVALERLLLGLGDSMFTCLLRCRSRTKDGRSSRSITLITKSVKSVDRTTIEQIHSFNPFCGKYGVL
jgi:hypothetical protein